MVLILLRRIDFNSSKLELLRYVVTSIGPPLSGDERHSPKRLEKP